MGQKPGLLKNLYDFLASVKLSVFIFIILAVCSIIGTLLPQGLSMEELQRHFSPGAVWWITTLNLGDLYHSNWFQSLLLLLCLNLIVCSIQRLPKTLKLMRHRDEHIDPAKLSKFNLNSQISTRLPWDEAQSKLQHVVADAFGPLQAAETTTGFSAMAEKGNWSRLMVYVVHFSILVVLIGAIISSLFGFKGSMNLAEGDTSSEVNLTRGDRSINLPFQVRCDDFNVSFYDTGAPAEFRSDLTIIEDGKEVLKRAIRVNDPLSYKGVTFYQASYGTILRQATLELKDNTTGQTYQVTAPFREMVPIPGTQDRVQIMEYQENLAQFGPGLAVVIAHQGGEPVASWILVNRPEFHGNRVGNYQIKATNVEQAHYTGLQVKEDPGVWVVWFGFVSMLVGIGLTFYASHRKLWVWAEPPAGGRKASRIIIAGRTNKNPLAFESEFKELCERLQNELKSEEKGK